MLIPIALTLVCVTSTRQDTTRLPIPHEATYPLDTERVVNAPLDSGVIFFRTLSTVTFDDTVSGSVIRAFLSKYRATIVRGEPVAGAYIIRVPDPGSTWEALDSLLRQMRAEPGVRVVAPMTFRDAPPRVKDRSPSDGPGQSRSAGLDARPALPADAYFFPTDTALSVLSPNDTVTRYYRTVIGIRFADSTSGTTVRRVLSAYHATIIGGASHMGMYIVRIPDPGPTWAALDSITTAIRHESGVEYTYRLTFRSGGKSNTRDPSDPQHQNDRLGPSSRTSWKRVCRPKVAFVTRSAGIPPPRRGDRTRRCRVSNGVRGPCRVTARRPRAPSPDAAPTPSRASSPHSPAPCARPAARARRRTTASP